MLEVGSYKQLYYLILFLGKQNVMSIYYTDWKREIADAIRERIPRGSFMFAWESY